VKILVLDFRAFLRPAFPHARIPSLTVGVLCIGWLRCDHFRWFRWATVHQGLLTRAVQCSGICLKFLTLVTGLRGPRMLKAVPRCWSFHTDSPASG